MSHLSITVVCLSSLSVICSLIDRLRSRATEKQARSGREATDSFAGRAARVTSAIAVGILTAGMGFVFVRSTIGFPHAEITVREWIALGAAAFAVAATLWDPLSRLPLAGSYILGFIAIAMVDVARGFAPGLFFLWGSFPEWAALMMVAAFVGWGLTKLKRLPTRLRIPNHDGRWSATWFPAAQAIVTAVTASIAAWVSFDFIVDGLGAELSAVFLTGRGAACPSLLMLLGGTILMTWQTTGRWRAFWQYATLAIGVLFTSSIGFARVDAASTDISQQRLFALIISTGMMTLMTSFGLARIAGRASDWGPRGRSVMPLFGGLFVAFAVAVVLK